MRISYVGACATRQGSEAMAEGQTSSNQKDLTPNPHRLLPNFPGLERLCGLLPKKKSKW